MDLQSSFTEKQEKLCIVVNKRVHIHEHLEPGRNWAKKPRDMVNRQNMTELLHFKCSFLKGVERALGLSRVRTSIMHWPTSSA